MCVERQVRECGNGWMDVTVTLASCKAEPAQLARPTSVLALAKTRVCWRVDGDCWTDTGKLQGRASAAGEAYERVGVSQHASVLHGEKKKERFDASVLTGWRGLLDWYWQAARPSQRSWRGLRACCTTKKNYECFGVKMRVCWRVNGDYWHLASVAGEALRLCWH